MATWLKTNGDQEEVHPSNPKEGFSLEELYRCTSGEPVEVLILLKGQQLWMNGEARITNLPLNQLASARAARPIYGDALLTDRGEVK